MYNTIWAILYTENLTMEAERSLNDPEFSSDICPTLEMVIDQHFICLFQSFLLTVMSAAKKVDY